MLLTWDGIAGKYPLKPRPHRITHNKSARLHRSAPKRKLESLITAKRNPYCPQALAERRNKHRCEMLAPRPDILFVPEIDV